LYLKTIYFVQYKVRHAGLCVPPKCVAIEDVVEDACLKFVEGDLLEQSIQPLEICQKPKSFKHSAPVVDPTPGVRAGVTKDCQDGVVSPVGTTKPTGPVGPIADRRQY
jgi:hypothetical protein